MEKIRLLAVWMDKTEDKRPRKTKVLTIFQVSLVVTINPEVHAFPSMHETQAQHNFCYRLNTYIVLHGITEKTIKKHCVCMLTSPQRP